MANRQLYFEASPKSYTTVDRNKPEFMIIYGTSDEVVDTNAQSLAFQTALRQAQFFAHKIELPSTGHYWVPDPFNDPESPNIYVGPRLLRFLEQTGTRPLIDRVLPLRDAAKGFAAMIEGAQTGKIVFTP